MSFDSGFATSLLYQIAWGYAHPARGQGHSKKALNGQGDGVEAIFGEDLPAGADRPVKGAQQSEDGITQRGECLRCVVGADLAGILGQSGIPAPMQLVFDAPMLAVEGEQRGGEARSRDRLETA
jgi:hypothetical protein